jgi:antitoxin (DNA-binding transcriptional repressor) of toxin-antitoxin stability system
VTRYTSAQARKNLARLLDRAASGEAVVIERGAERFRVVAERRAAPRRRVRSPIQVLDPAVESGNWSWKLGPGGLSFMGRRSRRR